MLLDIGRVCIKLKGREAGRYCVVIDVIDNNFVLVDGDIRRRRVNIKHLEPTDKVLNINKGIKTEDLIKEMYQDVQYVEENCKDYLHYILQNIED